MGGGYSRTQFLEFILIVCPEQVRVVVDGQLYTGQNPSSAKPLAEVILKALSK